MKNKRTIITLPEVLRRSIKKASKYRNCSQAEIIRISLYNYLKDFIEEDDKQKTLLDFIEEFIGKRKKSG